jgi:hypothetical protein
MPCRCDGYEVTAADVRRDLGKRIEHLEGQLCNAQSLIHKLLKAIDSQVERPVAGGYTQVVLPAELRERAKKHVAMLVKHKREEHEEDVKLTRERLKELDDAETRAARRTLERQRELQRSESEELTETRKRREEYEKLAKVIEQRAPTDEELLG